MSVSKQRLGMRVIKCLYTCISRQGGEVKAFDLVDVSLRYLLSFVDRSIDQTPVADFNDSTANDVEQRRCQSRRTGFNREETLGGVFSVVDLEQTNDRVESFGPDEPTESNVQSQTSVAFSM